jgi:hypothetical protein
MTPPTPPTETKPPKTVKSRRVPSLTVGEWKETAGGKVFNPAKHQPTGEAAKEITKLASWLRDSKNIDLLMKEGFEHIDVVRRELLTAELKATTVLKATVR